LEQTLAGILAISVPAIHWTGSVPKNDLLMAAWQVASLYAVLRWHKERSRRWLLLSAAMLGLAFEVKHIALFGAVPIGLLWVYAMWKGPKRAQTAAAVLGTFLAFGSFSVIRTWLATGNPVYPESASRRT
jgi:4-amino-4-deoxy-L-arabinose transferase-like glycosyltransferase